jgi:prephenate dehydrogenase|tara:strand:- start:395 stop:529 length:135 start_codon:yes stop_codon:yes gene_type:complete
MVNNSEYEKMLKELKKRFKAAKTVAEKNKYKNLINMAERLKKNN